MDNSATAINATSIRPKVLLFDVNETLLDLSEVRKKMNRLLDTRRGFTIWFNLLLQYTLVGNSTGQFYNFAAIAGATMDMAAQMLEERISDQGKEEVMQMLNHLPVQEDVQDALSLLRDADYRLAILTNMPEAIVTDRMYRTGLVSYFEAILSVEKIRKYKPATEVYQWAAATLGTPVQEVLMVAAHGWDVAGAAQAGMQTAFIQRPRQALFSLAPEPTFKCKNLTELASVLNATERVKNT